MRAHLVQFDIRWEDAEANFDAVRRLLDRGGAVRPGDLVVLPEMFDSGFSLNTERTADTHGRTLEFLRRLARDTGTVVQGGRTVLQPALHPAPPPHSTSQPPSHPDPSPDLGAVRMATNRAPVFSPDGELLTEYRKIHPFGFGREHERFVGGHEVLTYDWVGPDGRGLTVCPAICYDLRFPELFRRGVRLGAELFALGANWPEARQMHWRTLLIARAIENQAYVLGVNRVGRDPFLRYAGGSIAVDPYGTIVGELADEEAVLSVDINPDAPASWREKFSAVRDMKLM